MPYIFAFLGIALTAGVAFAQPTLVDPIEVFEGSLDNPDTEEIALHWDVTNLTNDTMHLMVTRSIVQLVSPYNLPYDEDNSGAYDRFCWGLCVTLMAQTARLRQMHTSCTCRPMKRTPRSSWTIIRLGWLE